MSDLTFIPALPEHAEELALTLRQADCAEVLASGFDSGLDALLLSLSRSDAAWAAMVDGKVAAMFGLARLGFGGAAAVWFLTGEHFERHARLFVRQAKSVVLKLLAPYASLENYIDARYPAAVRWAKWLGFDVREPVPYGPAGLPFHPAILVRS